MNLKENINQLLQTAFETHQHLFLIDLKITEADKINIILDGDNGVNLQDCIEINKIIDAFLETEGLDNAVEVSSCGAVSPMKLPRQYQKNINRNIKVTSNSGQVIEAKLVEATQTEATFVWSSREPKKIGKGKETVENNLVIPYTDIKEATVIISF